MTRRFLFSATPGIGHLHPLIPLARALQDAGHAVAFAAREFVRPSIEQAGFEFFPIGSDRELDPEYQHFKQARDAMALGFEGELFIYTQLFCGITPRLNLPALIEIGKTWKPDMFIREGAEYGAVIAAEHLGLPHATVAFTTALKGMNIFERDAAQRLNPLREQWGLVPDPNLNFLYRYLYLAFAPPSFATHDVGISSPRSIPLTTRFIRPQIFDNANRETLPEWFKELPAQPTVYVTLGTEVNNEPDLYPRVMQTIIAGLRELPINLIVTLGREQDPNDFGAPPDNVHIELYIPQTLLLPHCDLFVMHGGSNSLLAAFDVGLPLALVPLIADQFFNAHIVEQQELGRVIQLDALTPETIRAAVEDVLQNPTYRQNIARVKQEMHALANQEYAVGLLERVAKTREPIRE